MLVPDDRQLLKVALVWRGGASNICGKAARTRTSWRSQDFPVSSYYFMLLECGVVVLCTCECVFQFVFVMCCVIVLMRGTMCVWLPPPDRLRS